MNDAVGTPRRVLLLGGTSDIGLAIVRRVLGRRTGDVVLAARPSERLASAAEGLRRDGHAVTTVDFDARLTDTHARIIDGITRDGDLDLAIVAFGVLGDQRQLLDDPAAAVDLARTNYLGAISVGLVLAQRLRAQGHGAILALSSVAAERPRRSNFIYGASKAGLDAFFGGLADELRDTGVTVTVLRPGFVRTRMTAGLAEAPFATDAETVAAAATTALQKRAAVAWAPASLRWVMVALRHLPRPVFRRLDL